jgi:7,8-dihydropterin-6-yl-methyl-4-(beta-D-ribofuranosyl)aminobenzene 5'-phosphate synthase
MKPFKLSAIFIFLLMTATLPGQDFDKLDNNKGLNYIKAESGIDNPVTITVIYDNFASIEGVKEDWGYSIVIDGLEKKILFDTGTKPEIFESNFRKLGIDDAKIDVLVLSHEHGDHTGGILSFVKMKTGIPLIIPHSFTSSFTTQMSGLGLKPVLVDAPSIICDHLFTSGEFDYPIAEQALVLDTKKGLVVMTGCSHPGIVEMLKIIKEDFNKNIYMVFGGFHLMEKTDKDMEKIIAGMKSLGVVKCGATHCTGDKQITMFEKAFGNDYFKLGVGNKIVIN